MGLSNTKPFITPAHRLALDNVDQHTQVNGVLLKKIKKWFQRKGKKGQLHLVNCGLPAKDLDFADTFCQRIDAQLDDTHVASLACLKGIDVENVPAPKSASSCCVRFFNRGFKGCEFLGLSICSLFALGTLLICYHFFDGLSWLASTGIISWVIKHGSMFCKIIVACLIVCGFGKVSIKMCKLCLR